MNIFIPLGGKGERFVKKGFNTPKPLINIFEKSMIEYVLDNLSINDSIKVFIIYDYKLNDFNFSEFIRNKYLNINFVEVNNTKGAAETLYFGIEYILQNHQYHKKCLVLDCDTFYTENIIDIFHNANDNMVFFSKNYETNAIYSYIELDDNLNIINIKEKIKISDNANTGAYAFINIQELFKFSKHVLDNNITFNNEPYTSCVISEMIKSNIHFKGVELNEKHIFSLGTPDSIKKYIDYTHAFLFDLDGTLVVTDDIYYNVWDKILEKYNIFLTKELFKKFIEGNNDKYVLNTLLKNINISQSQLSTEKDELFIKNISNVKLVDGALEIINTIKLFGHKLCIVTNCNEKVAKEIVKYIGIDKYIDFIISSNDCINGKPHSEPYEKAIEKYNIKSDKCIIFEDSKTGILSGIGANPKLVIGIETNYSSNTLISYGANSSIKNYLNFDLQTVITNKTIIEDIRLLIKKHCTFSDLKDIFIDDTKLKGGFIADVISFNSVTNSGKLYHQIMKYENAEINDLSRMARQLNLYEREYYFYTDISSHVTDIKFPKYFNLIKNENDVTCGIVLENLFSKGYKINLNLNTENIEVTLKIVDRMAKLHSQFWNKNVKSTFVNLKSSSDEIFNPFFNNFIKEKYDLFKLKWFKILSKFQINKSNEIFENFQKIQDNFSTGKNLTLIHGDIKSPNIFYDIENNHEPYFIDWQHCALGKGVQDLMFFIIESFEIDNLKSIFFITKYYYYKKLQEYGISNYSFEEYENDICEAICYTPFFTSVWFGTIPQDELIDKNFPFFFISKMFYLLEMIK